MVRHVSACLKLIFDLIQFFCDPKDFHKKFDLLFEKLTCICNQTSFKVEIIDLVRLMASIQSHINGSEGELDISDIEIPQEKLIMISKESLQFLHQYSAYQLIRDFWELFQYNTDSKKIKLLVEFTRELISYRKEVVDAIVGKAYNPAEELFEQKQYGLISHLPRIVT